MLPNTRRAVIAVGLAAPCSALALATTQSLSAGQSQPVAGLSIASYQLSDHPDAQQGPPPYGLRLDGLFNGFAGAGTNAATTFSFDSFHDVKMTVTSSGGPFSIRIAGTVFGGEDTGAGYGFGAGAYLLNLNYTVNVAPMGTGYLVSSPSDGANRGTLTALGGIAGVSQGAVFSFFESNSMANPFKFLQDGHRLTIAAGGAANYTQAGADAWVGRGWLTFNSDGSPMTGGGFQDLLFVAHPVPLPTPLAIGIAALAPLAVARRRRAGLRR